MLSWRYSWVALHCVNGIRSVAIKKLPVTRAWPHNLLRIPQGIVVGRVGVGFAQTNADYVLIVWRIIGELKLGAHDELLARLFGLANLAPLR